MEYIVTYFPEFKKNVQKELRLIDASCRDRQLSAGILLIETGLAQEVFTPAMTRSSPVFIRHIMPVNAKIELTDSRDVDCENILCELKKICRLNPGTSFSVQCRIVGGKLAYSSKDIEVCVGRSYEAEGAAAEFSDREIKSRNARVLSVFIHEKQCYLGVSDAADNLSSHCDEYRIVSRSGGKVISRAENKLKEAICKFNIKIKGSTNALDMGAAPGGWSRVLADYGYRVAAVDPGDLHPSLQNCPNITHYKSRIENITFDRNFEIIVNDMNVDPQITAKIMCDLADKLENDGIAVITLKLPFYDVDRSLGESLEILGERYEVEAVKNLSHNRREVTALLRKRTV